MEVENSQPPRPPEPQPPKPPEVTDTSTLGGFVWVVLFGLVMVLSILANLLFVTSVLSKKKKRHLVVYLLLMGLFGLNLIDYSLLSFEFSLGIEHSWPHGDKLCALYQIASKGNPIIQAFVVVILVTYTASTYGKINLTSTTLRSKPLMPMISFACILLVAYGVLAVPTAFFAKIVHVNEKNYCEIEIGNGHQREISIYYLIYSAILSYWLPLMLSIIPLCRLAKVTNCDKYPEVTVVLATVSSFFIFYFLHGCIVAVRHSLDAMGIHLDTHNSWMIKVAQSLLWLVAYFWHVTRPLLALLMDNDLKFGCVSPASSSHHATEYNLVQLSSSNSSKKNNLLPQRVMLAHRVNESSISEEVKPINEPSGLEPMMEEDIESSEEHSTINHIV